MEGWPKATVQGGAEDNRCLWSDSAPGGPPAEGEHRSKGAASHCKGTVPVSVIPLTK